MRLLIHSPSPDSPTGYGQIVRAIAPRLQAAGHEVAIFQYNGPPGAPKKWHNGVTLLPRDNSYTGFEMLAEMYEYWAADRLISICDPWIVSPQVWRKLPQPPIFWLPVQAEPIHEGFREVLDLAGDIWVYSEYGQRVLRDAGYDAVHMPLGYNPNLYADLDKAECRQWFEKQTNISLNGKYLIGMVAANSSTIPGPRKGHDMALQAMQLLETDYPGEYFMYMHTRKDGRRIGGIDCQPLHDALKLGGSVGYIDKLYAQWGVPDEWMARAYAAFDVLLAPSMAEGFGLPILEAQMAGTPVVTTDWSSMTELVGYGEAVPPVAHQWADGEPGGMVGVPDVDGIVDAIRNTKYGCAPRPETLDKLRGWTWDAIAAKVEARLSE